ncbi:hypothetical protein GPY51_20805 [Photorhabdus laumondii subsp. laumondii]|uniref:Uncharacterized protein n=2 Tax=Morganellaceae TaxID=1903414 RepID=A0A6L9JPH6_PHOLM|nr:MULTISPECIES: hypothetical protein [Photorhabdus]RAW64644.1 hypothetical protein CKY15_22665 [Photorhabdus sp. S7-51]RAW71230.1 hypothetical protein CKY06_22765 [Photorhabdus sp. S15-56]RAW79920.1 hypothetical protein CKY09_21780 [Photorhabdus sp. S5P8-50]AWK40488.1 hypothetical protein A4R40_02610 [Photorhabdus laumondii subsp. laumondii]AXG41298.1 hypothetical protein PluDJC_02610 [Photorhabdus laumondii subsp. laumondii]
MMEEKKLYIFDKGIILPSITMFKSRMLNMAMQLIITALIYQLSTDDAGFFLLSSQLVQIFVVASCTFFIGINIKSDIKNKNYTYENYTWLLITGTVIGLLITLISVVSIHYYSDHTVTKKIAWILSIGIIPLCIYSVNCAILESTKQERYMVKVNSFSILTNVFALIALYLFTGDLIFSIALAISISRAYMAISSSIPLIKFIKWKKVDLPYIKDIVNIGINEALTSTSLVILMSILIRFVSTLISNIELSKLFVYMGVMNYLFVTGFSAVISLAANYRSDENNFLNIAIGTNLFYLIIFSTVSPLISLMVFNTLTETIDIITCALVIFFDLISVSIINRIRSKSPNSKSVYLKVIPITTILVVTSTLISPTSFEILLIFVCSNILYTLISLIWYSLWKKKSLFLEKLT